MRSAIDTLRLDALRVIYPSEPSYDLDDHIRVLGIREPAHRGGEL
jgi:hypothetical protein